MSGRVPYEKKIVRRVKETFNGEEIEVIYRNARPPEEVPNIYPPKNPHTEIVDDILVEYDVEVPMRGGNTILADICRPDDGKKVPALIAWSSGGKCYNFARKGGSGGLVPDGACSDLIKQEGADPGFWCHYGYAVINPDSPGVNNVDGDIKFSGPSDAEDCYDLIEWAAAQPWCNGRVGLHGTAFAGISSWFTAALQPPHLAAIAPWEASFDLYRAFLVRGGVLDNEMMEHVMTKMHGRNAVEDVVAMANEYPTMNGYWQSKVADISKVNVPVYMTASYNIFHCQSLEAWNLLPDSIKDKKWLRTTNTVSWRDLYNRDSLADLKLFFDRYLKNIYNGWEFTPQVRLTVFDSKGDQVARPEKAWPPVCERFEKLYLNAADGTLGAENPAEEAQASYRIAEDGSVQFNYVFAQDTEILGYGKLRVYVEADGSDDMDLFISVNRFTAEGKPILVPWVGQPHGGRSGLIRVSHRALDKEKSTENKPVQSHQCIEKLSPGEIVPVDIPLWPFGFVWHKGEQLRLEIKGTPKAAAQTVMTQAKWGTVNAGTHIFHTGGQYESYLLLPETTI